MTASKTEAAASSPADSLIVALDFSSGDQTLRLAEQLRPAVHCFKVGLELYLAAGNAVLTQLRDLECEIFLDLKLHDIPNTVAGAVRVLSSQAHISMLTVHAQGGPAMLRAASDAWPERTARLLAVTALTSMDQAQLAATGHTVTPQQLVQQLAAMAMEVGADGCVCSPLEVAPLRALLGQRPWLVVPGIRSARHSTGDQARTATAGDAIAAGANQLVVGRPITQASAPLDEAKRILDEIAAASAASVVE